MPTTENVLCVAFSARWMAEELAKAGVNCRSCDWFADADTVSAGPVEKLESWSELLPNLAHQTPRAVVFGGGFEGILDLATMLPNQIVLANASIDGAFKATDSFELAVFAQKAQIDFPEVLNVNRAAEVLKDLPDLAQLHESTHPVSNAPSKTFRPIDLARETSSFCNASQSPNWLAKKFRRGGGSHVERMNLAFKGTPDTYLQRYIPGTPISASFLVIQDQCVLLGICRQLLGVSKWGAKFEFQYSGAIGPLSFPFPLTSKIAEMGRAISQEFKLRGLFGIDLILDPTNRPWLIEVNPRPTGSMECLGRAARENLMHWHFAEFNLLDMPDSLDKLKSIASQPLIVGKGILYLPNSNPLAISEDFFSWLWDRRINGELADIPIVGSFVRPGSPLVTILVHGSTGDEVLARLNKKAEEIFTRLGLDFVR